VQPADLSEEDYKKMGKKMIWEASMKTYMKRVDLLEGNTRAIYAIVWGQCSPKMHSKLESLENYEANKSDECDCIWLIQEIQDLTHRFEGTRYAFISLDDAGSDYYSFHQGQHQTLDEYLKDLQTRVQVLEYYGAVFGADGPHQVLVMAQVREDSAYVLTAGKYVEQAVEAARKKSIAISFLKRADKMRHGGLWIELENHFTRGQDHYPNDLTGAYNLLLNYKAPLFRQQGQREHTYADEAGLVFYRTWPPSLA
jgi:hypothetical protein